VGRRRWRRRLRGRGGGERLVPARLPPAPLPLSTAHTRTKTEPAGPEFAGRKRFAGPNVFRPRPEGSLAGAASTCYAILHRPSCTSVPIIECSVRHASHRAQRRALKCPGPGSGGGEPPQHGSEPGRPGLAVRRGRPVGHTATGWSRTCRPEYTAGGRARTWTDRSHSRDKNHVHNLKHRDTTRAGAQAEPGVTAGLLRRGAGPGRAVPGSSWPGPRRRPEPSAGPSRRR
jgi:hypothetical protein